MPTDITVYELMILLNLVFLILGLGVDRLFFIIAMILDVIFGISVETGGSFNNVLFCSQVTCANTVPLTPLDYVLWGFTIAQTLILVIRLR